MSDLDLFFQTEVKTFEKELKNLDAVLKKVAPTFRYRRPTSCNGEKCGNMNICKERNRENCFPYKIFESGDNRDFSKQSWSTSTNSMMLNIATYLSDHDFNSVLIEGNRKLTVPEKIQQLIQKENKTWNKNLDRIFNSLIKCFETSHTTDSEDYRSKGFHDSATYGPNPCSTLVWFGEILLHRLKKAENRQKEVQVKKLESTAELWYNITIRQIKRSVEKNTQKAAISGYHAMRAARCYKLIEQFSGSIKRIKKLSYKKERDFKDKLRSMLLNLINQHLTSYEISDGLFDLGDLTFSMEGLTILDEDRHYIQDSLRDRFFNIINQSFSLDTPWKSFKPINSTNKSTGTVFLPLSADVGNSLLQTCRKLSDDSHKLDCFRKHKDMFVDYAKWILSQIVTVRISNNKSLCGWHSEHVMQPLYNSRYIDLWATREYFVYLMQYRAMQCENIAWDLVERNDFKVTPYKPPNWYLSENGSDKFIIQEWNDKNSPKPLDYWRHNIVPAYRTLHKKMGDLNVYGKINKNFLEREDSDNCEWSMLLYGPPGTGKTTIAQNLADALRWPLITITPSDFIQTGGELVEARAKQVFRSLELMQDVVVLFDEIDRLILDRDSLMYSEQNDTFQFMTPGMLVKLRDLWKAKRVIFIICTNYEERIDLAAKRRGRIDESLLVLPPDWSNRIRILIQELIVNHKSLKKVYKNDYGTKDLIRKFAIAISDFYTVDDEHNKKLHGEYKELKQGTFLYGYDEIKNLAKNTPENKNKYEALSDICNTIKKKIGRHTNHKIYEINKIKELPEKNKLLEDIFGLIKNKITKFDPPMINIKALSHRFKSNSNEPNNNEQFRTVQQPFYEFYGLYAMLALYCKNVDSELTEFLGANKELKDMSEKILNNGNKNGKLLEEYIKIKNIDFSKDETKTLRKVLYRSFRENK